MDLIVGDDGRARPSWAVSSPMYLEYYDTEWGVPVRDERGLFERLSLEVFQCGLSWSTGYHADREPVFRWSVSHCSGWG